MSKSPEYSEAISNRLFFSAKTDFSKPVKFECNYYVLATTYEPSSRIS